MTGHRISAPRKHCPLGVSPWLGWGSLEGRADGAELLEALTVCSNAASGEAASGEARLFWGGEVS